MLDLIHCSFVGYSDSGNSEILRIVIEASIVYTLYLSLISNSKKDLQIHEAQSDEWKNSGGEGGMPDQGKGVPKDECWILARLAGVNHIGSVGFPHCDFHELGNVQRKGEYCHRDNIDQESLGVGHGLNTQERNL